MIDRTEAVNWDALHSTFGPDECNHYEKSVCRWLEVFRYRTLRKYCRGNVIEFGCGCGYGSWMVSLNPDVNAVVGTDASAESVAYAHKYYANIGMSLGLGLPAGRPLEFRRLDADDTAAVTDFLARLGNSYPGIPDTVLAVEVLEHLNDPRELVRAFVRAAGTDRVLRIALSFPSFKTTHYNRHHLHDLTFAQVDGWVRGAAYGPGKPVDLVANLNPFDDCQLLVYDVGG